MIVENLGNPVFWDFTNALLYGSAHASNQLVQVPVAHVLDQNEVTLAQLTYCLGIVSVITFYSCAVIYFPIGFQLY
jgi:hypothetical protein